VLKPHGARSRQPSDSGRPAPLPSQDPTILGLVRSAAGAQVQTYPFRHWRLRGLFAPEAARALAGASFAAPDLSAASAGGASSTTIGPDQSRRGMTTGSVS